MAVPWLAVLAFICCCACAEKRMDSHRGILFWVPNNAGLFSHFLQLKIMLKQSAELNRQLVIVPTFSPHYGNASIDMCSIFALPNQVSCGHPENETKCVDEFNTIQRRINERELCYKGTIALGAKGKGRKYVLQAVDFPLRLRFTAEYLLVASEFHRALVQMAQINHNCSSITVVHWRRGDQLQGRCKNKVDTSLNCASASDLIHQVKQYNRNKVVYVATNEHQSSSEMEVLRTEEGWYTYSDVILASTNAEPLLWNLDLFQILVSEAVLMLRADMFLAWGLSEINDVIEHERKQIGVEYCAADRYDGKLADDVPETWCNKK